MNKYQLDILNKCFIKDLMVNGKESGTINLDLNGLVLIQNENYNIVKYELQISDSLIQKISIDNNEFKPKDGYFNLLVDFNNKIKSIEVIFRNSIVDNLNLNVIYKDADKEMYDEKVLKITKELYTNNMKVMGHETDGLYSVTFAPCSGDYSYSVISFFRSPDKVILKKERIEKGLGIAIFGPVPENLEINIIISQYDKNNTLLISQDVVIKKTIHPNNIVWR